MKNTLLAFLLFSVCFNPLWSQTTVYSQSSGNWTTLTWNTMADGSGSNITDPNSSTTNVVIQSNHNVILNDGPRDVQNITVEGGASLKANTSANRYLQIFGTSAVFDGTIGGGADAISVDVDGPSCTISGSGSIQLARLRKDNDPGQSATTDLTIQANITLIFAGTCLYNNSPTRTFNVTIESGSTVTLTDVNGDVAVDGTNGGPNGVNQMGTFTINGTLDIQGSTGDLYVRTDNTATPTNDVAYVIGSSGIVKVGGSVVGNNGSNNAAISRLTINDGGTLEIKGNPPTSSISGTRDNFTFQTGSNVHYLGSGAQAVESKFLYHHMKVSNSNKTLNGSTTVNGTLTLENSTITFDANNLTMGSSGDITGATLFNYLKTNSTGTLTRPVVASSTSYPIGNGSYNPATLVNSGVSDNFSIRVSDAVLTNGITGTAITSDIVNRTWLITEQSAGGSNVDVEVQWNGTDELSGFNRSLCYLSRHDGVGWDDDATAAAGGSGPYTRTRSGVTAFSPFAVGSNGLLPIELLDLKATPQIRQILLSWRTATERDNALFAVEHSTAGNGFTEIGRIEGAGTSFETHDYQFTDPAPAKGTNYYRLRQVDVDGRYSYSSVVTAVLNETGNVRVTPTPASDHLQVQLEDASEEGIQWKVFDYTGRTVLSGTESADITAFSFDVSSLAQGAYTLSMQVGTAIYTKLVIKR